MAMRPLDRLPSIRAKLGSVIVFAVAVTILIMYVAVGFALRRSERPSQLLTAQGEANAVGALAFDPLGAPVSARTLARQLQNIQSPTLVVDPRGNPLYNKGFEPLPPTLSIDRLLDGSRSTDSGRVGMQEYVGVPVTRKGSIVGAVYLTYRVEGGGILGAISATAHFVLSVWWQFLAAGAIAAFIALFLARILARGMTQPLRDMASAARRMARGDYGQRVRVRSRDEVGQLAEGFNRMASEMEGLERLRRDLVANVSHELKTPISAIRAHLENLHDGVEQPDHALLGLMVRQAERLSGLVDQLLELSRLESGDVPLKLEPVHVGPLVDQVASEIEVARSNRAIRLENLVAADLPPVQADRERIHQVLFNLLDNACRFSPAGGVVTVGAVRHNGSFEVTVEDRGPGIPEEHLSRVFERFYRVDPARSRDDGGTGIGLAIAKSVVEAHGGTIWAENRETGARFRFLLPSGGPSQLAPDANGDESEGAPAISGEGVKEEA
jgi:signal transduction histidine kinase